jgi:hypothetical protein
LPSRSSSSQINDEAENQSEKWLCILCLNQWPISDHRAANEFEAQNQRRFAGDIDIEDQLKDPDELFLYCTPVPKRPWILLTLAEAI